MRRVVKVGGSLLDRQDFPRSLVAWWEQQQPAETLLVAGGGDVVNAIRDLDATHSLDPVETHWLCVDLLDATFRLMSQWFPWPTITSAEQLQRWLQPGFPSDQPTLVAVGSFYSRQHASVRETLPQNWQTTTDSLAALLAGMIDADELVILKSCEVDPALTAAELSAQGIVDEAFPRIASRLRRFRVEPLLSPTGPVPGRPEGNP